MLNRGETRRAADLVSHVLKTLERVGGGPLARLHAEWADVVGPHLAHRTRPAWLRGAKLTVEVDDPILSTELARYQRERLVAAIAQRLGSDAVKDIIFRYATFESTRGETPS